MKPTRISMHVNNKPKPHFRDPKTSSRKDFIPEYIVCHPDDLEVLKEGITAGRLVPIEDEPPKMALKRMRRYLTKYTGNFGEWSGGCDV